MHTKYDYPLSYLQANDSIQVFYSYTVLLLYFIVCLYCVVALLGRTNVVIVKYIQHLNIPVSKNS